MKKKIAEIVLVEDDIDDAEMTMHTLKKQGFAAEVVVHLDDGVKALDYLFNEDKPLPSIVLLDLKMPRVDGIQVLRRLKGDDVRKDIPVIVLISSKEGKGYVESFALSADAYLIKPVNAENFVSALAEIGFE
jgi:two-component system response regulator